MARVHIDLTDTRMARLDSVVKAMRKAGIKVFAEKQGGMIFASGKSEDLDKLKERLGD